MFICVQNSNIQIYDLSTAWDITTASNVGNWNWTQGRTTPTAGNYDVEFNDTGTLAFVYTWNSYSNQEEVFVWSCSTPWRPDTSTTFVASYAVSDFTYSSNPSDGGALAFNDSGLKLYILSDKSHLETLQKPLLTE